MLIRIEGIWHKVPFETFGGFRVLLGEQTYMVCREYADAEREAFKLRRSIASYPSWYGVK